MIVIHIIVLFARFLWNKPTPGGRHRLGSVVTVGITYHPLDDVWRHLEIPSNQLWSFRMLLEESGEWHSLTMCLDAFWIHLEDKHEAVLETLMGDWRWLDYPSDEWPLAWQHETPMVAGSDLPSRGKELALQWT